MTSLVHVTSSNSSRADITLEVQYMKQHYVAAVAAAAAEIMLAAQQKQ
jgi:hypothetical protein